MSGSRNGIFHSSQNSEFQQTIKWMNLHIKWKISPPQITNCSNPFTYSENSQSTRNREMDALKLLRRKVNKRLVLSGVTWLPVCHCQLSGFCLGSWGHRRWCVIKNGWVNINKAILAQSKDEPHYESRNMLTPVWLPKWGPFFLCLFFVLKGH